VDKRPQLVGIVGWKNSGKTTLVERLVAILTGRGRKVATIKHTHHALRSLDGTTDGERHARAGASATVVIGQDSWELCGRLQSGPAPTLDALPARLGDVDLVIVEGFKNASIPKIEVRRRASQTQEPLAANDARIVAVAADHDTETGGRPLFDLDDAEGLAAFIERLAGTEPGN
jgi:molybdopterin-guanine dinucleotide biosynthesis protein B